MRKDIEFNADGVTLRGWFYKPKKGKGPFPCVVMAHGFSGVKEMSLDKFAEVFSAAGMCVLVYDNRCLGASDGEPRAEIDPTWQRRDYRSAITFAQMQKEVDPNRIGIWGTSYTGGTVCAVAALDRRVKCVVSQVPFMRGHHNLQQFLPIGAVEGFQKMLDEDRARAFDRGFHKHGELHAKGVFAKVGDLGIAVGLLRKVVAGKTQHHQATVFVFGVQSF
jgi:cephalosporin-C deacetylase-like acetyl esterase